MTSNMGSDVIQEMSGEDNYEEMKESVLNIVGTHFRPEFINRIDEIVVFHPLNREQLRGIAAIQTQYLSTRLEDRDLELKFTEAALDLIAAEGFDPVYGARPLKRAIQSEIENPLAQEILGGKFLPGDLIEVDAADGAFIFNKK
jgi:ATP-dependent Clp protease ATP-binding subunit ClpB